MRKGSTSGSGYVNPAHCPPAPIQLKGLILDCNIKQQALATITGTHRTTICHCINKGWFPLTMPHFKPSIEQFISNHEQAIAWLAARGQQVAYIWERLEERRHNFRPKNGPRHKALIPGNPDSFDDEKEKTMRKIKIPKETLKFFKLFKDPFQEDPRTEKEVFRSDDHRYLEYAMKDAAENSGLLSVIAEVGAGKSVMRREVIEKLNADDKMCVIYPQIVDRSRITAASLCDAIIMDLTTESPKNKLEAKSRQVRDLLMKRLANGIRVCLVIEEAHRLNITALKHIKVFHEFEYGRKKLLSILLLGQTELAGLLDEVQYPELRELSRRIQIAQIPGLGNNTRDYLKLKFGIVGGEIDNIITSEAIQRLIDRLTVIDPASRQKLSLAYPLTVNNYIAMAMKQAHDMGEEKITADVIDAI